MDTTTLLIIVLVILLLAGGGWYGRGRWYLATKPRCEVAVAGATLTAPAKLLSQESS